MAGFFDDNDDDDPRSMTAFTGSIFDLDGKPLVEVTRGVFERIDGIPARYEGLSVVKKESCLTPRMVWWDRVLLVTDDGLRIIIKCGLVHLWESGEVSVRFTSDPIDA